MNKEFEKDIVKFAKHLRELGVKYPKAYISGRTGYDSSSVWIKYREHQPKNDEEHSFSRCIIEETGELRLSDSD